jgi:hypothetical protein
VISSFSRGKITICATIFETFFLRVSLNDHYLERMFSVFLHIVAARVNLKDEKIYLHQDVGSWQHTAVSDDGMPHAS